MNEKAISTATRFLYMSGILVVCFIYFYLGFTYTVDFPRTEDEVRVLGDTNRLISEDSYNLFDYLFDTVNGHSAIVLRLLACISLITTGVINFKLIILLSNVLFFFYACFIAAKSRQLKWAFVALILLLSPTALVFYSSICMLIAYGPTIILLHLTILTIKATRGYGHVIGVFALSILMSYSFGNGIIALFILMAFTLHKYLLKQLSLRYLVAYQAFFLLLSVIWIWNTLLNTSTLDNVTAPESTEFLDIVLFPFAFVGYLMKYIINNRYFATAVGLLLVVSTIFVFVRLVGNRKISVYAYLLATLFLSGLLSAAGRCSVHPLLCDPLTKRYEVYGVLSAVFFILLVQPYLKSGWKFYLVIFLAAILSFFKYMENYPHIRNDYYQKMKGLAEYAKDRKYTRTIFPQNRPLCEKMLRDSERLGVYQVSVSCFLSDYSHTKEEFVRLDTSSVRIPKRSRNNGYLMLEGKIAKNVDPDRLYIKLNKQFIKLNLFKSSRKSKKPNGHFFFSMNEIPDSLIISQLHVYFKN